MASFDQGELERLIEGYAAKTLTTKFARAVVQTGIVSLDWILGGGFGPGIVEIYGEPSTGKSGFVGQTIAHNQQRDGCGVAIFPSEHIDTDYFGNLGVDLRRLPVLKREELRAFFDDFDKALLVIDSLTASIPSDVDRNSFLFQFLTELKSYMGPGHCTVVTSHVRSRVSVSPSRNFTGGTRSAAQRVLDCFDTRLELYRKNVSPPEYVQVVNVIANTLAPPAQFVELHSRMGYGVDKFMDLVNMAVATGTFHKQGNYYYFPGQFGSCRLGPGLLKASTDLRLSPELERQVISHIFTEGS